MLSDEELAYYQAVASETLTTTCAIARPVGGTTAYGTHSQDSATVIATAAPCRLAEPRVGFMTELRSQLTQLVTYTLAVAQSQDIAQGDVVTLASGQVLLVQGVSNPQSYSVLTRCLVSEMR